MKRRRLVVFCLDGYDIAFAETMIAAGELPHMAMLRQESARFTLDHGRARATGLAWEQFSTGLAPGQGGRWSAVDFDPETYQVRQTPTALAPAFRDLKAQLAVFDVPYFSLPLTNACGLTSWGSHDPGVAAHANPASLATEIETRFGAYPAEQWIYGLTWPSAERTVEAGEAFVRSIRRRKDVTQWLLSERLRDWEVALIGVSESHSALEQFWHGVDAQHPLHGLESAQPAAAAVKAVYREIDALVGDLAEQFNDAGALIFAMHGMGRNQADLAAMGLLPEFMFRLAKGRSCAATPSWRTQLADGAPGLAPDQDWSSAVNALLPDPPPPNSSILMNALRSFGFGKQLPAYDYGNLGWMPAARYQPYWRSMPAFAFPAFYDGQVRFNLAGRESNGIVALQDFEAERSRLAEQLRRIRCAATGSPVVRDIWYPDSQPLERATSEPDLYIEWQESPTGFDHPDTGRIGPYPWRRTGGHTGERGFAWLNWPDISGEHGVRSAFDITPTIFELMGEAPPPDISGISLLRNETGARAG